jgi:hypothetical protein
MREEFVELIQGIFQISRVRLLPRVHRHWIFLTRKMIHGAPVDTYQAN